MKTDINTIHLIVRCATLIAVLCLAAGVALAWHGEKDSALVLLPVTSGAVGGLLGLLAKVTTSEPTPATDKTGQSGQAGQAGQAADPASATPTAPSVS